MNRWNGQPMDERPANRDRVALRHGKCSQLRTRHGAHKVPFPEQERVRSEGMFCHSRLLGKEDGQEHVMVLNLADGPVKIGVCPC